MRLVRIEWIDSCSVGHAVWCDKEEAEKCDPHKCTSVGFVLSETDDHINLAGSVAEDQVSGHICIPKVCVVSMKEVGG